MTSVLVLGEDVNKVSGPSTWARGLVRNIKRAGLDATHLDATKLSSIVKIWRVSTVDVVHAYQASPYTLIFLLSARLFRRNSIYTLHGDIYAEKEQKKGIKRLLWGPLHVACITLANSVTVPSQFTLKKLISRKPLFEGKAKVIYNGYDGELLPQDRTFGYRLLTVTNFNNKDKARGILPLIKAVKQLEYKYPLMKLVVLGGGHLFASYKQNYGSDKVHFAGQQPAIQYICNSDLVVHASLLDNLPYSLIEAMSASIPTISTKTGGIPEILHNDCLVDSSPDSIAKKIDDVFKNKTLRRKIIQHNDKAVALLSWGKIVKEFMSLYENA